MRINDLRGYVMIFSEKKYTLGEHEAVLRSARPEEAPMLLNYLKTVTGETRFLLCEPDEVNYTLDWEERFIKSHNDSEDGMLILAFLDGEYAGNCSFEREGGSRRKSHRAGMGIALFQKYTGLGLGKLLINVLIEEMRAFGFEQAELTVVSNNDSARHLYESVGFTECGRIPHANKYDDGTYSDDVLMMKVLSEE